VHLFEPGGRKTNKPVCSGSKHSQLHMTKREIKPDLYNRIRCIGDKKLDL